MEDSFSTLYTEWLNGGRGPIRAMEGLLDQSFRRAWQMGDSDDRITILHFIALRRLTNGFDLVLEGLRSSDAGLAPTAAAVASTLILDGFDLGPTIREDLGVFVGRFPEWDVLGLNALNLLDEREARDE